MLRRIPFPTDFHLAGALKGSSDTPLVFPPWKCLCMSLGTVAAHGMVLDLLAYL